MFRKMRRFGQALAHEECVEVLRQEPRGVLSMLGEDGYPYGIPLSHWYDPESGNIYFHGAREGHKIDAIRKSEKVSFCVMDQGFRKDGEWALNIRSVVVFGRISPVEDHQKTLEICTNLCRKFTEDEEYLTKELESAGDRVLCLELVPEHISGKIVNES